MGGENDEEDGFLDIKDILDSIFHHGFEFRFSKIKRAVCI